MSDDYDEDDSSTEVETEAGSESEDAGATAKAVVEYVVSALVDDEAAVRVDIDDTRRTLQLEVRVGPDDMGRVIGRRGRVANAIRTLTRAAAARDGVEIDVEFVD